MAVQSDISSISYTGNNSTTLSYSVPFYFLENSHLAATQKVTATGVESPIALVNHIGAGDPNGGTVRTAVAVPASSTVTIFRTVPATQTTTYQEGGDFPAASHERALDKLTFLAQQNERAVERSFRVTEGSGTKNEVVAVPNTLLGLDATNQPKALTVDQVKSLLSITGVTLDVDAGMKTFADAGERALAAPDFTGQLGTQRDTADIYISTGTTAGDWALVDENMSLADFAAGFFTADATGRGKFANEFVDTTLIEDDAVTTAKIDDDAVTTAKIDDDAVTTAKIDDDAVTTAKIDDAAVTPTKLSQPFTLATSVATTSGTAIDFTGIPSWVRRVTVMLNGVSTNGTSNLIIQLGTSGGLRTSSYGGTTLVSQAGAVNTAAMSTGFLVDATTLAADSRSGIVVVALVGNNVWAAMGSVGLTNAARSSNLAGTIGLSGTLTQVRLTTINGTDTFDAGSVNISYEG